jgi:hypothetical protein
MRRRFRIRADIDLHPADMLVDLSLFYDGPELEKEDSDRLPHGHPARDHQDVSHDMGDRVAARVIIDGQARDRRDGQESRSGSRSFMLLIFFSWIRM